MPSNKEIGSEGEKIAFDHLIKEGYEILEQNYRYRRAEIDLIGLKDNLLIFFEVKALHNYKHGFPEERVNYKKIKMVKEAAEDYIFSINWERDIRFDIISLNLSTKEIYHIKDAFY